MRRRFSPVARSRIARSPDWYQQSEAVDGRDGLLVPPGEAAALADALRLVLVDRERRAALGEAAAVRANREFTVAVMAERYEPLYANVDSERRPRTFRARAG